mmetsp:Transcript_36359/g.103494  ORF Transcript_36359/g.103494 Transcript_36359/m.103494 type:complete len:281 (+) Transcript_36359:70-912(+)
MQANRAPSSCPIPPQDAHCRRPRRGGRGCAAGRGRCRRRARRTRRHGGRHEPRRHSRAAAEGELRADNTRGRPARARPLRRAAADEEKTAHRGCRTGARRREQTGRAAAPAARFRVEALAGREHHRRAGRRGLNELPALAMSYVDGLVGDDGQRTATTLDHGRDAIPAILLLVEADDTVQGAAVTIAIGATANVQHTLCDCSGSPTAARGHWGQSLPDVFLGIETVHAGGRNGAAEGEASANIELPIQHRRGRALRIDAAPTQKRRQALPLAALQAQLLH